MCNQEREIQEVYEKLVEEGYEPNKAKDMATFGVYTSKFIEEILERILNSRK